MGESEAKRAATERTAEGRFVKGYSGNPAGRPATPAEVREAAACHTLKAVEVLGQVLHDETASISMRFRAAQSIIRVARSARDDDEDADGGVAADIQRQINTELQRLYGQKK